jgi:hypothetical protein
MRTTRLLDHDESTGLTEYYHFDPQTNGFVIETKQEVSDIIELNKWAANNARSDWKGEMHHVARIPNVVLLDLAAQGIMTPGGVILDQKRYKAWINDPANEGFRVKRGRV